MNKTVVLLCGLLAFTTAGAANPVPATGDSRREAVSTASQPDIQALVRQARNGHVEAYEALAACYRDGNGVPQNCYNMLMMYSLACHKTGGDLWEILQTLDEDHPFRLLIEICKCRKIERVPPELVERLRRASTADARIFDAICTIERGKDPQAALRLLKQAEAEGSEMACIFQTLVWDHINDTKGYRRALRRYANRFPSLYVQLGESYLSDTADKKELLQAVKYYRRADLYGMLTGADARKLLSACTRLEAITNKTVCHEAERKRLENLSSND